MRVPFADLARGVNALRPDLDAAIARVLDSGWFILGQEVDRFERAFSQQLAVEHTVGVATGTDAIELALRALGVGAGDEVVTQANTCAPTVAAIERTGATPVLCDVDLSSATIDAQSAAACVGPLTKALVPVHLYGQIGDVEAIAALAEERGVPVVEDCAQAHGARAGSRAAGAIGRLGAFSFYPTKNLGALGDGGAVVTGDAALDGQLRLLRQYGQSAGAGSLVRGVNSRLDELQAAILSVKLEQLDAAVRRRREIASVYTTALSDTPVSPMRTLADRTHSFHLYVVRAPDRGKFQQTLRNAGVGTLSHYDRAIHEHPAYADLGRGPVALVNAQRLAREVVSLPLYPELTDEEVGIVADAARAAALEQPDT